MCCPVEGGGAGRRRHWCPRAGEGTPLVMLLPHAELGSPHAAHMVAHLNPPNILEKPQKSFDGPITFQKGRLVTGGL